MKALHFFASIALIVSACLWIYHAVDSYKNRELLYRGTEEVLSALATARTASLESRETSYGVHIEARALQVFAGETYASSSRIHTTYTMPDFVLIDAPILNGGGNVVVFRHTTGTTEQFGTCAVRTKSGRMMNIFISQSGVVTTQ